MSILAMVDRGLAIREQMERLAKELKEIEARLKEAGLKASLAGRVEDLKDAERDGRRWLATGSRAQVPVLFTADLIVGSFAHSSETHRRIAAASDQFVEFFKPLRTFENRFKDGKKFRASVAETLGAAAAPAFVTACVARDKAGLPKSDVKILWDETEVKA